MPATCCIPDTADGVIATGFFVAGPFDFVGQIEVAEGTLAKAITRNLDRDDMVANAIGTFNSMTAQCARCHNHKFDPITQEDYYSLQAVFAGIDRADRPYPEDGTSQSRPVVFAAATDFEPQGQFTPTEGKPRPVYLLKRGNEKDSASGSWPWHLQLLSAARISVSMWTSKLVRARDALHWLAG